MSKGSYYYSENGEEESWGEFGDGLFDTETYSNQVHDENMADLESEYRSQGKSVDSYTNARDQHGTQIGFSSNFAQHGIPKLKQMIAHADPEEVRRIARHWEALHNELVGGKGDGDQGGYDGVSAGASVVGRLKKAAEEVLTYWEGAAADGFKSQVDKVIVNIQNGATYAHTAHTTMNQVADDLHAQKTAMEAIEEPDGWDSVWDAFGDNIARDDTLAMKDIKHGVRSDVAAKINEDDLSAGKEAQLNAASIMEQLGTNYNVHATRLKSRSAGFNDNEEIPPHEPSVAAPAVIPAPSGSASPPRAGGRSGLSAGVTGGSKAPLATGPRDAGISGGQQVPAAKTKTDSLPSGITGGAEDTAGGGSLRGGGASGGVGSGGTGASGGGLPGGGMLGGGGAAAGRGTAARGGVGGMGAGAGAGAGKGGVSGGAGRGPLARAKGGTLGAAKGITGGTPATPGGTGLGRGGRGGTAGMLGGGGRKQRLGNEEREQGSRPDYLVEDEETWAPEDNRSVPGTIE